MSQPDVPDDEDPMSSFVTDDELAILSEERAFFNENQEAQAKRMLGDGVVAAVKSITKMAVTGSTERIRFEAAKYVVDSVLGRIQDRALKADEDDPVSKLLAQMEELDAEELDDGFEEAMASIAVSTNEPEVEEETGDDE